MGISKASPRNNLHYQLLFVFWTMSCVNSTQHQTKCIETHLKFLQHFPIIIFCLNIFEIVLFLCYNVRIETNPFQLKFTFKGIEKIIMEIKQEYNVENMLLIPECESH
ncbi:hypothetical protein RF11_02400 [Thelohanellus kitauei]|uniref:Uncharacterized protein n=1 Tax=Thelohanellus kitauei TaxID=669202 RepID=A0A0C2MXZ8_THEKT|nr:hypothetical protein RF11_02400 [Thelohanellus kitauei]